MSGVCGLSSPAGSDTTLLAVPCRLLHPAAVPPAYAHPDDAGADLVSVGSVRLEPGRRALVPTGLALSIPSGWVGLVHPRSGLAARHGVGIVNAPGTVDAGYTGEILVNLVNHDPDSAVEIAAGDRIAQLVLQRVEHAHFVVTDSLAATDRGASGHGSTGGYAASPEPAATQGSR